MKEDSREAVGFLCRWGLLVLASLAVATGVWTSVAATASVADNLAASIVVPDEMLSPDRKATLVGYPSGLARFRGPAVICDQPVTGRQGLAWVWRGRIYAGVERAKPGRNMVLIKGLPYGGLAFLTARAIVQIEPRTRTIFLADVRMAIRQSTGDPTAFRKVFDQMRRQGEVAFFSPDAIREFPKLQRWARREYPATCVLCAEGRAPNIMTTLSHAAWALNRSRHAGLVVVTDDAPLARASSEAKFETVLIGPARPDRPVLDNLQRYETQAAFGRYLAAQPIR